MTRKQATPRTGICVYCGEFGPVTDDHVPPQNVFSKPHPPGLIKVPACPDCHRPWSKEDEYFRLKVGLNQDVARHPDAKANLPIIMKSLQRQEAHGFLQGHIDDCVEVEVFNSQGESLGTRLAYDVNLNRIFGVVERTVRGLFYHETGQRLPDTYGIVTVNADTILQHGPETAEELFRTIVAPLRTVPPKVIGQKTFAYKYQFSQCPPTSAWHLTFYGTVPFLCMIAGVHNGVMNE